MAEENYHIRKEDWDRMRQSVEETQQAIQELKQMLYQFLEREKASDANISRAQSTADEALRVAYDAKNEAEKAQLKTGDTTKNVDRWQDWAFKVSAVLICSGVTGFIGYMVAT